MPSGSASRDACRARCWRPAGQSRVLLREASFDLLEDALLVIREGHRSYLSGTVDGGIEAIIGSGCAQGRSNPRTGARPARALRGVTCRVGDRGGWPAWRSRDRNAGRSGRPCARRRPIDRRGAGPAARLPPAEVRRPGRRRAGFGAWLRPRYSSDATRYRSAAISVGAGTVRDLVSVVKLASRSSARSSGPGTCRCEDACPPARRAPGSRGAGLRRRRGRDRRSPRGSPTWAPRRARRLAHRPRGRDRTASPPRPRPGGVRAPSAASSRCRRPSDADPGERLEGLLPTPHSAPAGNGSRNPRTPVEGTTRSPSGLHAAEASLATNFRVATPTEQVTPTSRWTVRRIRRAISGGSPKSRIAPATSKKASSSEIGSTRGVNDRRTSRNRFEALGTPRSRAGRTPQPGRGGERDGRHRGADPEAARLVRRRHHDSP